MRNHRVLMAGTLMIMIMFMTGCASVQGFGKFTPDNRAGISFEAGQVNPDYRYYLTGSDTYPVAILALNKSYSMGNDLWKEVPMTPNYLKEMVTMMQLRLMECCQQSPFGFLVYTPEGKPIGMMYSYLGVSIAFQVNDRIVIMYGPRDDDQLKRYQGRTYNNK